MDEYGTVVGTVAVQYYAVGCCSVGCFAAAAATTAGGGMEIPWCGGCYAIERGAVQCDAVSRASWWDFVLFFLFLFCFVFCLFEIFFVSAVGSYYKGPPALYCNSSNCLGILHCKLLAFLRVHMLWGYC